METRPWGSYEILAESDTYKVKRITVNPNSRISYQSHTKRSETWVIASGEGLFILDEQQCEVKVGSVCKIPAGAKHRIINTHPTENLVFTEVQTGDYFGEDDIVRYVDDYGRAPNG